MSAGRRFDKLCYAVLCSAPPAGCGELLQWLCKHQWLCLQAWRRHEYATISASTVSMHLAEEALSEGTRQRLLARNRALLRDGYARLSQWIEACEDGLLSITPPEVRLS